MIEHPSGGTKVAEALASLGLDSPPPLPTPVLAARTALDEALQDALAIPDDALTRPWRWRGIDGPAEINVRYGLYRLYELLEEAAAALGGPQATGGRILCQANAARWALHGLLLPVTDEEIDREPGDGEWTIRQTLAHLVMGQWHYSLNTAYWARRGRVAELPLDPPQDALPTVSYPAAELHAVGSLAEVRHRLDGLFDLAVGLLAGTDAQRELGAAARWNDYDVTVRFRLHRFASHLREHTIQIEQTLALLRRRPREVERIVREIAAAYGRLEGRTYGLSSAGAGGVVKDAATEVRRTAAEVRAAAGA